VIIRKGLVLIIIFALLTCVFIEGCGCGKKAPEGEEGAAAEGEPAAEGETPPEEAARSTAPPPPAAAPAAKPPAAKPPAAKASGGKGAEAPKAFSIKAKNIPDDKFLPIEFDTREAALVSSGQAYNAKVRRNVYRDIKSSSKLRKDAEMVIEQAKKIVAKVKAMPAGSYSEPLFKSAEEKLKEAEDAFKSQNYFKAKAVAEKAVELAGDALPKIAAQDKQSIELAYKGYYQLGEEKTAMLTKKDPDTGAEKLFMIERGNIISEELPNFITIDNPDGTQTKTNKIEYRIDSIEEDFINITNITERKSSIALPLSKTSDKKTSSEKDPKKESAKKEAEKSSAPVFQSNQTTGAKKSVLDDNRPSLDTNKGFTTTLDSSTVKNAVD